MNPSPGKFDFSGQNDVAEFIREAQQEGLFVLLRPRPLRLRRVGFRRLSCVAAARSHHGGAHIESRIYRRRAPLAPSSRTMSSRRCRAQMADRSSPCRLRTNTVPLAPTTTIWSRSIKSLLDSGFDQAMLYTADGADELPNGSLPELPAVINFGSGDAKDEFAKLAKLRPNGPRMCGEYWDGWFDHWGEKHHFDGSRSRSKRTRVDARSKVTPSTFICSTAEQASAG